MLHFHRFAILLVCLRGMKLAPLSDTEADVDSGRIEDYENFYNEIHLEDEQADAKTRNALQSPLQRWPTRNIRYRIGSNFTATEAENVREALKVFAERTCVSFEELGSGESAAMRPYVSYTKSVDMCGTRVGYTPLALLGHNVAMNPFCLAQRGVIQHETLHVLGLYHEQSRPDRDGFVQIEYDNIDSKYWPQFMQQSDRFTTTYDVPYDYESLMHYSQFAFAKDPKKPSIRALQDGEAYDRNMGQVRAPSEGDLRKINIMYQCE